MKWCISSYSFSVASHCLANDVALCATVVVLWQVILGGNVAADEGYDAKFYETFRKQNLVQAAVNFAQVSCMWFVCVCVCMCVCVIVVMCVIVVICDTKCVCVW